MGQALRRERLAAQTAELEITRRRPTKLKSALLDSVSHDLRTPLATIRAAAGQPGGSRDSALGGGRRVAARAIDDEAERLNQLVGISEMSRIQAGALVAEISVMPLSELIESTIDRLRSRLVGHELAIEIPPSSPA